MLRLQGLLVWSLVLGLQVCASGQSGEPPVAAQESGEVVEQGDRPTGEPAAEQVAADPEEAAASRRRAGRVQRARGEDLLATISRAVTPRGALGDRAPLVRTQGEGRRIEYQVACERAPFRWRVTPGEGGTLGLVEVVEGGVAFPALFGAWLVPGEDRRTLVSSRLDGQQLVLAFDDGVALRLHPVGRSLAIDLEGPPAGRELSLGGLPPRSAATFTRVLQVPFVDHAAVGVVGLPGGAVRYLTTWLDPARTNAGELHTRLPGEVGPNGEKRFSQVARYLPNTEGQFRPLRERLWVTWADELLDALPSQDRPAAPHRARAAELYLMDLNRTPFRRALQDVRALVAHGVEDAHVWIRHWQRGGYDVGYPTDVLPPNPEWGGEEGLLAVREALREAGFGFSLHHNWVFNGERREAWGALGPDGGPRTVPDGGHFLKSAVARELAEEYEAELHRLFDTEGSYTDSLPAIAPVVDYDAGVPGWGLWRATIEDWGHVLAALRRVHGPPLAGEGSLGFGQLLWAGMLDWTQGYLGYANESDAGASMGRNVPVVPDYVLGVLHPLWVRTGLGEPLRYFHPAWDWDGPRWERTWNDELSTLEALYAAGGYHWWAAQTHPGDAIRHWWARAEEARRLAAPWRRPEAVHYADGEGKLLTLSEALAAGLDLGRGKTRVRVTYRDGLRVWANLTESPWQIEWLPGRRRSIAPWGRLVLEPDYEGGLLDFGGDVYEVARSSERFFMDSRGVFIEREGLRLNGAVGFDMRENRAVLYPLPEYLLERDGEGVERLARTETLSLGPSWITRVAGHDWATRAELVLRWIGPEGELVENRRVDDDQWLELPPERWLEQGFTRLEIRAPVLETDEPLRGRHG
jgi:hypothetical protein